MYFANVYTVSKKNFSKKLETLQGLWQIFAKV